MRMSDKAWTARAYPSLEVIAVSASTMDGTAGESARMSRQSLECSAFPGRAWERWECRIIRGRENFFSCASGGSCGEVRAQIWKSRAEKCLTVSKKCGHNQKKAPRAELLRAPPGEPPSSRAADALMHSHAPGQVYAFTPPSAAGKPAAVTVWCDRRRG